MSDATIVKSVFFNAQRETVWEFLTDKDKNGPVVLFCQCQFGAR